MTAPRMAPPGAERYDGWRRLAEQAAKELPLHELDRVWTFPKLRHDRRELGTAVFSRVLGERRIIYTGRWALVIRGGDRGQFAAQIEEVGSGPLEALEALLLEVRRRVDDAEPPVPVSVEEFFGTTLVSAAAAEAEAAATALADVESSTVEPDGAEEASGVATLESPALATDAAGDGDPPAPDDDAAPDAASEDTDIDGAPHA